MSKSAFKSRTKYILSAHPRLFLIAKSFYFGYRHGRAIFNAEKIESGGQIGFVKLRRRKKVFFGRTSKVLYSKVREQIEYPKFTLEICIPYFNRFDQIKDVLDVLIEDARSLRISYKCDISITVLDDKSTTRSLEALYAWDANGDINVITRKTNLGFLQNVNTGWREATADYFLLLNSDVKIHQGFLAAMLSPLLSDSRVALVTAPTFSQYAELSNEPLNYISLAKFLNSTRSNHWQFIDACTAVGYAMAIRKSAVDNSILFDPEYGRGYGEDSDLHYRILSKGFRSVWTLDTVVSHAGGASFDLTNTVEGEREQGRSKFFHSWGANYFADIEIHQTAFNKAASERITGIKPNLSPTTWFLVPGHSDKIGGLLVAQEYASKELGMGKNVQYVILDSSRTTTIGDFIQSASPFALIRDVQSDDTIVIFGAHALKFYLNNLNKFSSSKCIFFAQGPDWLIDPSTVEIHLEGIPRMDRVISTSKFLDEQLRGFGWVKEFTRYSPNLDHAFFSGLEKSNKQNDFLLLYREEAGKAGWFTLALANYLGQKHKVSVTEQLGDGSRKGSFLLSRNKQPLALF